MVALTPALTSLRAELNALFPNRDKASDGWIGDSAHQSSSSDHNNDETGNVPIQDADRDHEVHALDIDTDLKGPVSMETVVQHLLTRCRAGLEPRLRYIIYRRRIWSATSDWVQRAYTGSNPHDQHAHFSGSYDSAREADTRSWRLATLTPPAPRKLTHMRFEASVPVLKEGDDDADFPGYNMIARIQRVCGLQGKDADGVWGPRTTAAIRDEVDLTGVSPLTETVYRRLFGLTQ